MCQLTTPEQTQLPGGAIKTVRAPGCARVHLGASWCARVHLGVLGCICNVGVVWCGLVWSGVVRCGPVWFLDAPENVNFCVKRFGKLLCSYKKQT